MAFVDEVKIFARAGKGGNGIVHWLRTKETARGGPDGGDGGRGGDVMLIGVRDYAALSAYRHKKKFQAEDGEAGRRRLQHGKDGAALLLPVPLGTLAYVTSNRKCATFEIIQEAEPVRVLKGGAGGKGNARYKRSTHQNPFEHTDGKEGESADIEFKLKLIANAGLIGLPNAGKSSLLNALTRASSKVGDYPFTTLTPNLGTFYNYVLADIPGLIEGASAGRGLGTRFLKHIERTKILLHLVSADHADPLRAYEEVRTEIEAFSSTLAHKREIIILSKTDLVSSAQRETILELLSRETGREVLPVSIHDSGALKTFRDRLVKICKTS